MNPRSHHQGIRVQRHVRHLPASSMLQVKGCRIDCLETVATQSHTPLPSPVPALPQVAANPLGRSPEVDHRRLPRWDGGVQSSRLRGGSPFVLCLACRRSQNRRCPCRLASDCRGNARLWPSGRTWVPTHRETLARLCLPPRSPWNRCLRTDRLRRNPFATNLARRHGRRCGRSSLWPFLPGD